MDAAVCSKKLNKQKKEIGAGTSKTSGFHHQISNLKILNK